MKRFLLPLSLACLIMVSLTGCVGLSIGSGDSRPTPTVGQQLIDLQKAKDAGAINDQQYEAKKAQLLQK